jgi:hypothetical protein
MRIINLKAELPGDGTVGIKELYASPRPRPIPRNAIAIMHAAYGRAQSRHREVTRA